MTIGTIAIAVVAIIIFVALRRYGEKMTNSSASVPTGASLQTTTAIIDVPPTDSGRPSMYVPSPYQPSYTRRWLVAML